MAVRVSQFDLDKIIKRLPSAKLARTVSMRAINRAMEAGKVAASREVAKDYTVKQRQVRDRVTSSRASTDRLEASVTWRGHALNLADFKVSPGKPQPARRPIIRATVSKKDGPKPYKGAFLINTRRGIKAFRRTSEAKNSGERYPITGVWGPSIPHLIGSDSVRDAVEERAQKVLEERLDHEINRELSKL